MTYEEFCKAFRSTAISQAQFERLRQNADTNAAHVSRDGNTVDHPPVVSIALEGSQMGWLISEIWKDEPIAFGLADLSAGSPEMGSIDLSEIAEVVQQRGLTLNVRSMPADAKPLTEYADAARKAGWLDIESIHSSSNGLMPTA